MREPPSFVCDARAALPPMRRGTQPPCPLQGNGNVEIVGTLVVFITPRPRRETWRVTGGGCSMVLAIMPPACLVLFWARHRGGGLLLGQFPLGEMPGIPRPSRRKRSQRSRNTSRAKCQAVSSAERRLLSCTTMSLTSTICGICWNPNGFLHHKVPQK